MFAARRRPKKITSTESREDDVPNATEEIENDNEPVVRRPTTTPKQKSKLRISFDPSASAEDSEDAGVPVRTGSSSRLGASALSRVAKTDRDQEVDRPNYSKSYLNELKGSTPTTPKDLSQYNSSAEDELAVIQPQTQALDIASKFGSSALRTSVIPSAAEIAEKKERRNRLAKEENAAALTTQRGSGSVRNQDDFVSLDAYDSDGEFKPSRLQVSSYLRDDRLADASEHTRLVPEDEEIAEGFDDFVEDDTTPDRNRNRINMGMKSNPVRDRANIKSLIDQAEGGSGSDSDGSESENSDASAEHAYMTSQTRHGAGFSHLSKEERRRQEKAAVRPRQPEKTTPVPTLTEGLARLRELRESADMNRQRAELRQGEIERRLKEVEGEKSRIQSALEDLGTQLEESSRKVSEEAKNGDAMVVERGLEGLGAQ